MATAATIESTFFHPKHLLERSSYGEASTHPCAACERAVTGTGYRCDDCGFHIHEACLALPRSIPFGEHKEHELTLTRLGASRWCDICKETSHAGSYMYMYAKCNVDVHPRCLMGGRRQGRTRRAIKVGFKIGMFGFKVVDLFTGGILSPVFDAIELAIDQM